MGLTGYRSFKDKYIDDGKENLEILDGEFSPDFFNRHTIQIWDISATDDAEVVKWTGATLTARTSHEITIVNNSGVTKHISFDANYNLMDEAFEGDAILEIGAYGSAHFYATALIEGNNLIFSMRTGSQDDRKIS